jgi:hypothetical protein
MFDPMARKPPEQAKDLLERTLYQNLQGICHEKEVLSFQGYPDIRWDVKDLHDLVSRIEGLGCPNSFSSVNKEEKQVTSEETHSRWPLMRFSLPPLSTSIMIFYARFWILRASSATDLQVEIMTFSKRLSHDLLGLWKGKTFFADRDGDGYPDHVDMTIVVSPDLKNPHVWAGVLNLVARIAFEVIALQPPLVIARRSLTSLRPGFMILPPGRMPLSGRGPLFAAELWRPDRDTSYLSGSSGEAMMALLNALAAGGQRANPNHCEDWVSLRIRRASRFTIEALDAKERLLGTYALKKKTFGQNKTHKDHPPPDLLNLAGPGGLYQSQAHNPRTRRLDAALQIVGSTLSAEVGLSLCDLVTRMVLEATDITLPMAFVGTPEGPGVIFKIRGSSKQPPTIRLLRKTRGLPQGIQIEGHPKATASALRQWAQWAFMESGPGSEEAQAVRSRVTEFREFLHHRAPDRSVPKATTAESPKPLHLHLRWRGEVREVLDLAERVPRGLGKLVGEVFVSKPLLIRRDLEARLEKLFRRKGYAPKIKVLNAYKPGLSWLLEEILPELRNLSLLHILEFRYQPYVPVEKALEMRSRWLQEFFPGLELVARALVLDQSRVRLSRRAAQKSVYEIRALNSRGAILFQSGFSPVWTAFPYLAQEPDLGFVHPTTSGIKLLHENRVILNTLLPTDREFFWRSLQNKWLPLLLGHMNRRVKKGSFQGESAFWKEIRLDVSIDETDERLSLGNERICPMEALHEDLYFVLLDAFSHYSKRHGLADTLQLGRIVPRVLSKAKGGIPSARLVATPLEWRQPPGKHLRARYRRSAVSSLTYENRAWGIELRQSASNPLIAAAGSRGFKVKRCGKNRLRLWLRAPRFKPMLRADLPSLSSAPPKNRPLKAAEVSSWIERLASLECIGVWQVSHSLLRHPLWALEAVLKKRDSLTSLARMRLLKPTFLFNARHHANEVSSTNAALYMAWLLGTTPLGRDLLRHVNVAWIPLENPDGAATLEELLPYGKDHMLHAARYNALGVETYGDYFAEEPRFPEALAKTRLWRRWLPEVMVDHHGVPGHEWDQPFSGYAPLRFREFWIPRNFVYACIPFINEPNHPHHRTAMDLSVLLQKAMSGMPEIVRQNRELALRYHRYARGPEPATFPDSKGEPMLVLPLLGRTYHTNFAVRYPAVTRSEIILEVPDEGAYSRGLALCVEAHLKAEEALLCALRRTTGRIDTVLQSKAGFLRLKWVPGELIRRH